MYLVSCLRIRNAGLSYILRYCVASSGARNSQDVEREFFEDIDIGQLPIFVIFTQYDKLLKEHEEDISVQPIAKVKQRLAQAEEPAFKDFENNLEREIMSLAKTKPQIKSCRIAILQPKRTSSIGESVNDEKGEEYKLQKFRVGGEFREADPFSSRSKQDAYVQ